jgi:hypothetical protein
MTVAKATNLFFLFITCLLTFMVSTFHRSVKASALFYWCSFLWAAQWTKRLVFVDALYQLFNR